MWGRTKLTHTGTPSRDTGTSRCTSPLHTTPPDHREGQDEVPEYHTGPVSKVRVHLCPGIDNSDSKESRRDPDAESLPSCRHLVPTRTGVLDRGLPSLPRPSLPDTEPSVGEGDPSGPNRRARRFVTVDTHSKARVGISRWGTPDGAVHLSRPEDPVHTGMSRRRYGYRPSSDSQRGN